MKDEFTHTISDDKTKTGFLWELAGSRERLQVVKAELLEEGSFDGAVQGVHTVFHTACPVLYDPSGDPQVRLFLLLLPLPLPVLCQKY